MVVSRLRPLAAGAALVLISGSIVYAFSAQEWGGAPQLMSSEVDDALAPQTSHQVDADAAIRFVGPPPVGGGIAKFAAGQAGAEIDSTNLAKYQIELQIGLLDLGAPAVPLVVAETPDKSFVDVAQEPVETISVPSVLENELRAAKAAVEETLTVSSVDSDPIINEDLIAPIPMDPPSVRIVATSRVSGLAANPRSIVPGDFESDVNAVSGSPQIVTASSDEDLVIADEGVEIVEDYGSSMQVLPTMVPIPMPVHQRPHIAVVPRGVEIVTPARSVSVDPMVHDFAPGSWPRRLDQVNARANVEDYVTAEIFPDSMFLSDWIEITDQYGTRLVPRANVGE